jgi:biotin synthase
MEGDTPNPIAELLDAATAPEPAASGGEGRVDLAVRLWDPSTQLRYNAKRTVPPRPDGAPNRVPVG